MKKKALSVFLALILTLASIYSSSISCHAEEKDNTTNPEAVLMYVPCTYWDDGQHHWVAGQLLTIHKKLYQHNHLIYDDLGGIIGSYTDWYCNIYTQQDYYCACGKHDPDPQVFVRSHCHK